MATVAVLNDLNLVVNPGEIVVLVGPSGCGKTTILNLLSGHIKPVSGSIQREGIIRTVYQHDGLFPMAHCFGKYFHWIAFNTGCCTRVKKN